MTVMSPELQQHWTALRPLLSIRNEHEYDQAAEWLNHLLDEVGTNEPHPLYTLLDTLEHRSSIHAACCCVCGRCINTCKLCTTAHRRRSKTFFRTPR